MKTTRAIWLCGAVSIAAAVCLANEKVQVRPNSKKAPAAALPVQTRAQKRSDQAGHFLILGHLETRDRIVTIQSGPEGLRYLVKTKNGKVLHENLNEQQLKAQA